jgi:hypothetical protein
MRGKHAVVSRKVCARRRHERGEPREQDENDAVSMPRLFVLSPVPLPAPL